MFNFTTQSIYNSIVKTTTKDIKDKKAPKGYNLIVKEGDVNPEVRIGNTRFNKANVLDIQMKNHTVENLAKVEFDIAKLIELITKDGKDVQDGDYRITLYIGLSMNSQEAFYSNALIYKGKPFYIEFSIKASDTPADVTKRIKKIAERYMLLVTEERILNITDDDTKIIIEGVNGYQQIKKASIQKYDPNAKQIDCCNNNGDYIDIITGVPVTYITDEDGTVTVDDKTLDFDGPRSLADNEVGIEPGLEAFCDYNWIMHNLRLPTLANTNYWSPTKGELPVVGGTYTQFIIRLCVDRDGIAGGIVGQRATSVTTHVLYVLDQGDNVATLKAELEKLVNAFKTDADDTLQDPYGDLND